MFLLNGKKIDPTAPLTVRMPVRTKREEQIGEDDDGKPVFGHVDAVIEDDLQLEPGWVFKATDEDRERFGFTEVADPVRKSDRFYIITENEDGSLTQTPRDLDMMKAAIKSEINASAYARLAQSDWQIIANIEGRPIDPGIREYRAEVRLVANNAVAAVMSCADIPALEALTVTWPQEVR